MNGYVKLYRKLLDNPIICKDSDHLAIWIYLLLNATHDNIDMLFKGQRITLIPGQLITGRKSISSELNISESKVHRVIKTFESEHQIEQQISNKNRLITILNWSSYQSSEQQNEQQVNNKRTTSEQQVNTNKNVKNDKNERIKNIYKDYGEFSNVKLTEDEYEKLKSQSLLDYIDRLSTYLSSTGKRYKSHYATILTWARKDETKPKPSQREDVLPDWYGKKKGKLKYEVVD